MLLTAGLGTSDLGADDIAKAVAAPLSPGTVALLARYGSDTRVVQRLREALANPDSPVRTVGARAAAVGNIGGLLSDLKDVLAKETDAEAAREEIRALCTIGGPAADPEALTAAKRFSPRLDAFYVAAIARLRGVDALPVYFASLRELALSAHDREVFFQIAAIRAGPQILGAAGSLALARHATADWSAILAVASERNVALDEGPLIAALRGEDVIVRGEAAWYLARAQRRTPILKSAEILDAVTSAATPPPDPELRFGIEMLRRALGSPPQEDEGWISCLETNPRCHLDSDLGESPLVDLLTEREGEAVLRRNKKGERKSRSAPEGTGPAIGLRLVTGLPPGMVSDLMAVSGCKSWTSPLTSYTVAEIDFAPNGLPRQVHVAPLGSSRCETAAEAIFLMTVESDESRRKGKREFLMAILDPGAVCDHELPPAFPVSTDVQMVRGAVTAPRLEKKTEPTYPMESRRQHHQGVSIVEAIISATGCVGDLYLLRSSSPELDAMAMVAVAHWRYAPATLNGRPVRVYLTVTITFALH